MGLTVNRQKSLKGLKRSNKNVKFNKELLGRKKNFNVTHTWLDDIFTSHFNSLDTLRNFYIIMPSAILL